MPQERQPTVHEQLEQFSALQMSEQVNEPEPEALKQFREKYVARAENFLEVIKRCLGEAKDDQQRQEMFELLCETSKEFMRKRHAITDNFGCPANYTECPDGSCVPKGQLC